MKLFETIDSTKNVLPKDGTVFYWETILKPQEIHDYFERLLTEIHWENDRIFMFGKLIETKRKVAWYGDEAFEYIYSKVSKKARQWTPALVELKKIVETITGETYNSCLLNLYHNGNEGMSWHSDDEKELKKNGAIASLSLGATRKFQFKHKTSGELVSILLENGSLLLMTGTTQTFWLHQLPISRRIAQSRINLTFRTIQ